MKTSKILQCYTIILLGISCVYAEAIRSPFNPLPLENYNLVYEKVLLKEKRIINPGYTIQINKTIENNTEKYILTADYAKGVDGVIGDIESYLVYKVDAASMLPERMQFFQKDKKTLIVDFIYDYANKKIISTDYGNNSEKTFKLETATFDYWGWDVVFLGLPLEKIMNGEKLPFQMYYTFNGGKIPVRTFEYIREESITVPAGTFLTYRIDIKFPAIVAVWYKQTYWIEKDKPHRVIKSTDYKSYEARLIQ